MRSDTGTSTSTTAVAERAAPASRAPPRATTARSGRPTRASPAEPIHVHALLEGHVRSVGGAGVPGRHPVAAMRPIVDVRPEIRPFEPRVHPGKGRRHRLLSEQSTPRLQALQASPGEVGEPHGRAARGHRHLAEGRRSAPGRGVVDVHVGGQAAAHAVDETPAHHVVHASVAALLRRLPELGPQRVFVLLLPLLEARPLVFARVAVEEDARRVTAEDALGARHEVDAVVGPRVRDVVLEQDGAALGGLEQARVHVAAVVLLLPLRVSGGNRGLAVRGEPGLGRAHGDHVVEAVPLVDAEIPGHRPEAMGGIEVPVAADVLGPAPQALGAVLEHDLAQVVVVGALGVQQLAEEARLHHAVDQHLLVAVVAVLDHHAVAARPLGDLDELPALLEGHRRRHLDDRRACPPPWPPPPSAHASARASGCTRGRGRPASRAPRSAAPPSCRPRAAWPSASRKGPEPSRSGRAGCRTGPSPRPSRCRGGRSGGTGRARRSPRDPPAPRPWPRTACPCTDSVVRTGSAGGAWGDPGAGAGDPGGAAAEAPGRPRPAAAAAADWSRRRRDKRSVMRGSLIGVGTPRRRGRIHPPSRCST